jgi:hypothetical protein
MTPIALKGWRKVAGETSACSTVLSASIVAFSYAYFRYVPIRGHIAELEFFVYSSELINLLAIVSSLFAKGWPRIVFLTAALLELCAYSQSGFGTVA